MNFGLVTLFVLAIVLFPLVMHRHPEAIRPTLITMRQQFTMILLRMPFALIAAAYLGLIIPPDAVAAVLGEEGGARGVLAAFLIGAIIPGGPVMMFPLALILWRSGAGEAQMVSFLTSWTVVALQRSLTFEIPLVGVKFAIFRLASSWMMPLLAGGIAMGLVAWTALSPP
ncbi:hypothetical protein [Frigidibacter sp. ROC022]|uniref:hypothetical protein n=1 Tax=Frigidibacter sp. ROC022 TaxID=2971796 RepID=UPI00215B43F0|nr:hypothetical protein [Frigidibacter sp. ROC022]MCR8724535.1 hypothetical protein [Frigidibacter sp. ROC022]